MNDFLLPGGSGGKIIALTEVEPTRDNLYTGDPITVDIKSLYSSYTTLKTENFFLVPTKTIIKQSSGGTSAGESTIDFVYSYNATDGILSINGNTGSKSHASFCTGYTVYIVM